MKYALIILILSSCATYSQDSTQVFCKEISYAHASVEVPYKSVGCGTVCVTYKCISVPGYRIGFRWGQISPRIKMKFIKIKLFKKRKEIIASAVE